MSLFSIISLLLLLPSLSSAVNTSFQKLPLPKEIFRSWPVNIVLEERFGPQTFAFNSTGKGFYTAVSGGKILKYTPETGFVDFAYMTKDSKKTCSRHSGMVNISCGRVAGIAFSNKTGDLYVADSRLGLHVVSPAGGMAIHINVTVDGKPLKFVDGLDVDPTTGVVYFTSLSRSLITYWTTGNLYKYDPLTKVGTLLMEGLSSPAGCAVSSDGSFVLVSQFTKNNIKKYWIKGPKAGSSENFTNSIVKPDNIRRIGYSGNFWVASMGEKTKRSAPNNSSAVKVNTNGTVIKTIPLMDKIGKNLLTEVNEFNGSLYIGTRAGQFVGILKL